MKNASNLYGVMAEFATPQALLDAVARCRSASFAKLEAFAPFSIDGLPEALGFTRNRVPLVTLIGGLLGGIGGYFMQWYSAVVDYPINAGGRPLHAWPAFIPATFELAVLGAALAAFFGFLALNGLPRLRHPVFDAPDFDLASRSRFFLCVRAYGTAFDADAAERFLRELAPVRVMRVDR
ncbi:MAG: DUF3341 domain-containing protein [Betaproteobacteria bacterium]|nr:MAG: DUF3341 domain-containing protein [Betaproteobacteria bacterium]